MKKVISLLLVLILLMSFVACNKNDTEKDDNTPEKNETAENGNNTESETAQGYKIFFDDEKYTTKRDTHKVYADNVYAITTEYTLNEKVQYELSDKITIDSTTVTVGVTSVKELTQSNWTLEKGNKENSVVKAHMENSSAVKNSNGKYASIIASNSTDAEKNFSECLINFVSIRYDDLAIYYDGATEASGFIYDKGISNSSTPADIINKLGEAQSIKIVDYFENDEYRDSTIYIFYNDESIALNFIFNSDSKTEMAEVKLEKE